MEEVTYKLRGFTDSDFQLDVDDKKSTSRFVFTCNGGEVSWKSSKQSITTDSTTEAKYVAAWDAAKEAVCIQKLVTKLGVVPSIESAVPLFCNNNGAIALAKKPRSHQKSKYIERHFHVIRELVGKGDWCVLICKRTESYQVVNKDIISQRFEVEYRSIHNV